MSSDETNARNARMNETQRRAHNDKLVAFAHVFPESDEFTDRVLKILKQKVMHGNDQMPKDKLGRVDPFQVVYLGAGRDLVNFIVDTIEEAREREPEE